MSRRWSVQTRAWAYRYLVLRDGEICAECTNAPTTFYGLDIDHIDGNIHNKEESNLRLLCRRCNVSRENKRRAHSPSRQRESERVIEIPRTRVVKSAVVYHSGSVEMQANLLFEIDYRSWLFSYLQQNEFISKKEAINAGAEFVGCNPSTSAKYLSKLTSLYGPLMELKDMLGEVMVVYKPSSNVNGHTVDS